MKKILAILMALMMLASLFGCAAVTPTGEVAENRLGTIENGVYKNEFFGITAKLDADWTIASEERLAELVGLTADAITDEAISKQLEESGVAFDLYASTDDDLTTLNVCIENIGLLYGAAMDESAYADAALGNLVTSLESIGLEDVTTEKATVPFAGKERVSIAIHATTSGIDFYETLVILKQGNYIATVTASSYFKDVSSDILDNFTAIQ